MSGSFRFGEFELDVAAYALRRAGQRIKLEKIPMEVLVLLVRKAGILVNRTEIQAALWGSDVFVDQDAAINTAIRKIRRALADDAEHPRFVETVVGKGYRFIAPLEIHGADLYLEGSSVGRGRLSSDPLDHRLPNYLVTRGKRQFVLNRGENLLGRDPEATVYIDHPSVSRRHARLSIHSARAVLEDLKSRNGTFLDGRHIETPTEIQHGAIIGLGPITLTFVVLPAVASTLPMGDGSGPTPKPKS
ncbi:MAG: FHA domain-containing protein [Acidobacteria bacterium]|nr:FHA domain-containing protein [Acidobacteriota bacterium]